MLLVVYSIGIYFNVNYYYDRYHFRRHRYISRSLNFVL